MTRRATSAHADARVRRIRSAGAGPGVGGAGPAPGVRRGRADERGSGTVLVLGVVAVAGVLLAVVALLVGAQGARGRAQAGADLAALAAAQHLLDHGGAAEACEIAQAVARRNDVRLVSCSDVGSGVVVVSTVRASAAGPATAQARAGPVSARS